MNKLDFYYYFGNRTNGMVATHLESFFDVEDSLDPGTHDHDGRTRKLAQVGGHVEGGLGAPVYASHAARDEYPYSHPRREVGGRSNSCRPVGSLNKCAVRDAR